MSKQEKLDVFYAITATTGIVLLFITVNIVENCGFSSATIVTSLIGVLLAVLPLAIDKIVSKLTWHRI